MVALRRFAFPLLSRAVVAFQFRPPPLLIPRPIIHGTRRANNPYNAATAPPLAFFPTTIATTRTMGGGPRNPEHKERFKQQRVSERRRKLEMTKESPRERPPPTVVDDDDVAYAAMERPIPKRLRQYMPAIESYVVNEWLVTYPLGARLRKLQRDIAFRLKPSSKSPGKIDLQFLLPIVGELQRKGLVRTRQKGNGVLVILSPETESSTEETQDDEGKGEGTSAENA